MHAMNAALAGLDDDMNRRVRQGFAQ